MLPEILFHAGKVGAILTGVLTFGGFLTWVERKQSAVMQDRIGANRADILGFRLLGLFHIMTDGIKMFMKEEFIPRTPHRRLFVLAPFLSWTFALMGFAVIPFSPSVNVFGREFSLQISNPDIGILFVFAMMGMSIYGVVLGGWASNNNFALLGSMRATAQMISYEVAMGAAVVGPLLVYHTLNMQEMVLWQGQTAGGWLPLWGIVVQPVAFLIFLTAGTAKPSASRSTCPRERARLSVSSSNIRACGSGRSCSPILWRRS